MNWTNVSRRVGTHARLVSAGTEVQTLTEHTVTFYQSSGERPDEFKHPFYTGVGPTQACAEEAAYLVYLRAKACTHAFASQDVGTLVCRCGVMQRCHVVTEPRPQPWWQRWWGKRRATPPAETQPLPFRAYGR